MNNAMPTPGQAQRVDPEALATEVAAALQAAEDATDAATQLQALETLHQRLAAALTTIDRA
ncbi:MAG: hypothetical protein ABI251_10895 [Mycobacteriaceae bacterium]